MGSARVPQPGGVRAHSASRNTRSRAAARRLTARLIVISSDTRSSDTRAFTCYVPVDAETILASITDGFFALDAEWRFAYLNRQAERLIQHTASEVLGRVIWDVYPEGINSAYQAAYERALAKRTPVTFEAYYPPLATWFAMKAYPTEHGGLAVYFHDVTTEKQTAIALRESEERFRATFEQAPVGIALVDPQGRWLHVNRRLCEILGYSRKELLARRFQEITYLADLPVDLEQMEQTLRGEIRSYDMEKRYLRKGGNLVWCHLTMALVRAPDESPKYFVAIIEDISGRKEAEAVLGGAAHELRLPLSHIKGFVSSLRRRDVSWDAPIRSDFLREIEYESDRLGVLIGDLLERANTGRSGNRRRRVPVSPRGLAYASLERVRSELNGRDVVVDVPEGLPLLAVDEPTMERVLANLIHNAHKYSPLDKPVRVSAHVVKRMLELCVEDHGLGVPEQDRERVFEPFYRRDPVAQSAIPGKGLGLAICRSIVTAHAGRIWAEDRPGGGARFVVALPFRRSGK